MKVPSSTFAARSEITEGRLSGSPTEDEFRVLKEVWANKPDNEVTSELRKLIRDKRDRSLAIRMIVERYKQLRDGERKPEIPEYCEQFRAEDTRIYSSVYRELELEDYFHAHPEVMSQNDAFPWPVSGEEIADFLVEEELGQGGIGHVYLCRQRSLSDRHVVVKMSRYKTAEANTLAVLAHPNITPIFSKGWDESEGLHFLVMPYFGRSTLDELLEIAFYFKRPDTGQMIYEAATCWLPPAEIPLANSAPIRTLCDKSYVRCILDIAIQLADALAFADSKGVIHGDVKPSNVLLTPDCKPLLLDFNLSHNTDLDIKLRGGTLPYMSPEQIAALTSLNPSKDPAKLPYDRRTDVYALGVLLYQLLTGVVPFHVSRHGSLGKDAARELIAEREVMPPPVSRRNRDVSKELSAIIAKAIAAHPDQRFAKMAEFHGALVAERDRIEGLLRQDLRRRQRRKVLLTGTGLLLTGFAGVSLYRSTRPSKADQLIELGLQQAQRGQLTAAKISFLGAITHDPYRDSARYYVLQAALKQNQFDEIRHLRFHAPTATGDHPMITALLAWQEHSIGRPDLAEEKYRRALGRTIRTAGLYNNLGYAILAKSNMIANASAMGSSTVQPPSQQGRTKELREALDYFRLAVEINPSLAPPRRNYIAASLELGKSVRRGSLEVAVEYAEWIVENFDDDEFESLVDPWSHRWFTPHAAHYRNAPIVAPKVYSKSLDRQWLALGIYDPLRAMDPRSDFRLSFITDNYFDTTDLDARSSKP